MAKETNRTLRPEEEWVRQMAKGLLGKSNDVVKLAWLEGEDVTAQIGKLNLSLLSEFKRNANGTVEIKLVDRVKALEELSALLRLESEEGISQAEAIYRALERRAADDKSAVTSEGGTTA